MLGCAGGNLNTVGENAKYLATVICATVLAGELSLLAAQCTNDLVRSHMKLNRSSIFKQLPEKSEGLRTMTATLLPNSEKALKRMICDKNSCVTGIL